jgi:dienelactone hydrolase
LDLIGHGQSDGAVEEGNNEIDLGVSAAVKYLQSLPYVNSSEIELVGHSLGGGAVRAEAAENKNILSTVLIAGGLGAQVQSQDYGVLNATFPKNLLIIVGKYDILFNVTKLKTSELLSAFNCSRPVIPGVTYGSVEFGTARRLVEPSTTHLLNQLIRRLLPKS